MKIYKNVLKRFFDFVLSLIALLVLSPLLVVIYLCILCNMGKPVIFIQKRIGKNEKVFNMYKFRTMIDAKDKSGKLLPDSQRETKLGLFLRKTSIDELPELINIIKGDMSIVGPRPLLVEYLPYYTEKERVRHHVRGGLVQPEVLYDLVTPTWEEQFRYEVEYVESVSFFLDIKIIFRTFKVLFKRTKTNYGSYVRKSLVEERKGK